MHIFFIVTAMRHYQFQVNMSQDYELLEVKQDNPQLIAYIRQMHLRPVKEAQGEYTDVYTDEPAEDLGYILKLLNNKVRFFIISIIFHLYNSKIITFHYYKS